MSRDGELQPSVHPGGRTLWSLRRGAQVASSRSLRMRILPCDIPVVRGIRHTRPLPEGMRRCVGRDDRIAAQALIGTLKERCGIRLTACSSAGPTGTSRSPLRVLGVERCPSYAASRTRMTLRSRSTFFQRRASNSPINLFNHPNFSGDGNNWIYGAYNPSCVCGFGVAQATLNSTLAD